VPAATGPRFRDDRGAAVIEFTLVSVLLVFLFLMVMQLGLVLHTRNVMVSAAQEGARFAANADRSADDGVLRTQESLRTSLGGELLDRTSVTPLRPTRTASGAPVVGIRVSGPLPFLFLPVGPLKITVEGHALDEGRP
jgi:Flp pilus assembly protein TadG